MKKHIAYWVYAEDDDPCTRDRQFLNLREARAYYQKLLKQFKICVLTESVYGSYDDLISDHNVQDEETLAHSGGQR